MIKKLLAITLLSFFAITSASADLKYEDFGSCYSFNSGNSNEYSTVNIMISENKPLDIFGDFMINESVTKGDLVAITQNGIFKNGYLLQPVLDTNMFDVCSPIGFNNDQVNILNSGVGFAGGKVDFTSKSNSSVETGISNGLSNLWAGFTFLLPYLGVALGIMLVIGVVMFLIKRAGR